MRPQRSLRLEKRSARSLDTLSGASGEIFYDVANGTLRLYTDNAGSEVKMATQPWVSSQLGVQGTSIQYSNLIGAPTSLSAFTNDVGFIIGGDEGEDGITSANITWVVYEQLADLPPAADNHGMFAHVHGTGRAYYAHAGLWVQLANQTDIDDIDLTGLGITYTLTELNGLVTLTSSEGDTTSVSVLTASGATLTGNLAFNDDVAATFGSAGDLSIRNVGGQFGTGPTISSSSTLTVSPTTSLLLSSADVALSATGALLLNSQQWPSTGGGNAGYVLATNGSNTTTWTNPASAFSVTTAAAGTQSLTYDNTTGIFTFTPEDLSSLGFSAGVTINEFSSDSTLGGGGAANNKVSTQLAVKSYVDTAVTNGAGAQDVYKNVVSDDGTAVATGLTDSLTIQGGTNIATAIPSNSDTVQINMSAFSINFLSDVDTTSNTPSTGEVLKWDGTKWAPGTDATTGGAGTDADTLDGFDGSYYLNYNNFSNTPTVLTLASISVGNELTASGDGAISYDNSTGVFRYTPPDLSSYLTTYTESNDLTSAVTWANVPDANITQGSVTQHQASLSITESQISDLQTYLTSYTVQASDLNTISVGALSDVDIGTPQNGQVLTWNNVSSRFQPATPVTGNTYTDSDVSAHLNTNTANTGQILSWDGSDFAWADDATGAAGGGDPDQNLFATAEGDTGTYTAASTTDTLIIAGGTDIATSMSNGTVTVNFDGSIPADISELTDTTNLLGGGPERFAAITQLLVTAPNSSYYEINNQYSGQNPTVYAISGLTIAFELNCDGHPFVIETSGGTAYNTGLIHVADNGTKTTGASAQGKTQGMLYWQIPVNVTGNYAYQCSFHSAMRGTITIKNLATL